MLCTTTLARLHRRPCDQRPWATTTDHERATHFRSRSVPPGCRGSTYDPYKLLEETRPSSDVSVGG
eukprot:9473180-Pyramimonas_sp.AAC.1